MLTTATHDHKRGEDVRARLSVLSEVPDRWAEWVDRMAEYGSVFVTQREEGSAPSLRDQYILLQTLVGTWPFSLQEPDYPGLEEYRERIAAYLGKASREAKLHTSWTNPDEAYEAALERFIESILSDRRSSTMLRVIGEFVESIVLPGALNGLSQKLLTVTAPGVPDVYQGTEGWDLSLVDPDNRRPVDFTERREWLDRHAPGTDYLTRVLETWRSGEIKFAVVAAALALRRSYPDVFAAGTYIPIEAEGEAADHLVAFARVFHNDSVLVVVPRLTAAMLSRAELPMVPPERWAGTHLLLPTPPDTTFTDVFADRTRRVFSHGGRSVLNVQDVLSDFPVALLYAAQSEWSDGGE
jgi:(1->4)-alpha-D-glucan 1-alpha-D-glucosylmutase